MDLELVSPAAGRQPDPLWDALMLACEIDQEGITSHARGAYNKAVAQLRRVRAAPSDVEKRAEMYRERFPHSSLTPSALCRHWPELKPRREPGSVIVRDGEVWMPGTGWSRCAE